MRLNDAIMYDRFRAADPAFDGRFFTGVETTGIYCLPSCKARKPRRENVRFFPSCSAARQAGFRPCRKCHPDDFERGIDPLLDAVEALVAEMRANPAAFADVGTVVRRSGFGTTRLFELFRRHYHRTPAEVLAHARLEHAKRELIRTDHPLARVASEAGFESLSVFHAHFRAKEGLSPGEYRALRTAATFTVRLPPHYPLAYLRRALTRDPHSVNERWTGNVYEAAVRLGAGAALLRLTFEEQAIAAEVQGPAAGIAEPAPGVAAHRIVVGLLGLGQDGAAFARLARRLGFGRLVQGRHELRVSQTPSVFDGLMWAIIGQQINLPFACLMKRRLFELAGTPVGDRLFAPPAPAAVAALDPAQLKPLQFSRQKADYLIGAARRVAGGDLDLEGLKTLSATRAERTLLAVRGLGPWSVNYILMRALGHPDCLPLGDTGVTSGLKELFALEVRPGADETRRLMAIFSPYRSLATAHLWQLLQSPP